MPNRPNCQRLQIDESSVEFHRTFFILVLDR